MSLSQRRILALGIIVAPICLVYWISDSIEVAIKKMIEASQRRTTMNSSQAQVELGGSNTKHIEDTLKLKCSKLYRI